MPIKTFLGDNETHDKAYNAFEREVMIEEWIVKPEVHFIDLVRQQGEEVTQTKVGIIFSAVKYKPKEKEID